MAVKPPNPFDPAEIAAYKASREESSPAVSPDTPRPVVQLVDADVETQAQAVLDQWASLGLGQFTAALEVIADNLENMAGEMKSHPDHVSTTAAYQAATLGKALERAGKSLYNVARPLLWERAEREYGDHTTPEGDKFTFKAATRVRRTTDLPKLRAQFPEAYAAVVSEIIPDPDAPGTLLFPRKKNVKKES